MTTLKIWRVAALAISAFVIPLTGFGANDSLAVERSQTIRIEAGRSVETEAFDLKWVDVGPYSYNDPYVVRDFYRALGHASNVITGSDSYYYARVFYEE